MSSHFLASFPIHRNSGTPTAVEDRGGQKAGGFRFLNETHTHTHTRDSLVLGGTCAPPPPPLSFVVVLR